MPQEYCQYCSINTALFATCKEKEIDNHHMLSKNVPSSHHNNTSTPCMFC